MKENTPIRQQPTIVKYSNSERNGIEATTIHRHAIGYILQGKRYIYYGDTRHEIPRGSVYYLRPGTHQVEDIPESGKPFEQIVFFYDTFQINRILNHLSINYMFGVQDDHSCENCRNRTEVSYPAWGVLRHFFDSVNYYHNENVFGQDEAAENIKMTELVYIILTNEQCCLKRSIASNMDPSLAIFEQIIQNNIFNDVTIEELARLCNRSLTSFKKEFKKHYNEPPHKWFVRQRLMHASLQLISTQKSVAEIGNECNFPNTSHFIKLFKKEYKFTPVAYRNKHPKVPAE